MFNVLYADPSWKYSNIRTGGSMKSGASQQYETMSLEEICALEINKITEPNCILALWITNPLLFSHAQKVLESWGFEYKTLLTWKKPMGLGFWFRGCTEHLIIALRGNVKPFRIQKENFIQTKHRLGHSVKPPEARQLIDEAASASFGTEARKLELFAQTQTESWTSWGLGVDGKTIQEKIEEYCPQNQPTNIVMNNEVIDV